MALSLAAVQTLLKYFRAVTGFDLMPGVVAVIQTFGDRINFHPHIHVLVTEGGAAPDGVFHHVSRFHDGIIRDLFTHMVCEIKELEKPVKDPEAGSTDVAEVSWITPTLHISTTCAPFGVPWHSWAIVASSRHSIGHKGMLLAAKVMATTAIDFLQDAPLLIEMKKEFKQKLKGYTYKSGVPPGQKPPLRVKKIH